jgi:hypothetical protein
MTPILAEIVTMEPVVRVGRAAWDQRLLPRDEFAARLRAALDAARRAGLDALVVFGHAARSECLTYLTNFVPSARWGALVAVPGREPVLLAGLGGQREGPYQRTVTWVRDLVHAPLSGATLRQVLADRGATSGRLGVVGLRQLMPADRVADIEDGLAGWELVPLDTELAALWRVTGPRERAVLAAATAILEQARQQAVCEFSASRSVTRSAAAADRLARLRGCRDVRILIGSGDGSLRPYQGVRADGESGMLVAYLTAEWLGYWTELAFSYPHNALAPEPGLLPAALSRTSRQVAPGVRPEQLRAGFTEGELHVRGLGLSITELPDRPAGWDALRAGDVISLLAARQEARRVILHSTVVDVTADGGRPLQAWPQ